MKVAVLFFGGPDDREALSLGLRMAEHPGISMTIISFVPKDAAELALALAEGAKAPTRNWSMASLDEGGMEVARAPSISSFVIMTDKLLIDTEAKLDNAALALVKSPSLAENGEKKATVVFEEREVDDAAGAALAVGKEGFDLVVVGRARRPSPLVALLAQSQAHGRFRIREDAQRLGPVGEELVGQDVEEAPFDKVGEEEIDAQVGLSQPPSLLVVQQYDPELVKLKKSEMLISK